MQEFASQFSRYRGLVSHLAGAALAAAERGAPDKPGADSLMIALPAARTLLTGEALAETTVTLQTLAQSAGRWVTLTGQHRPVYDPLAAHLVMRAMAIGNQPAAARDHLTTLSARLKPEPPRRETVALVLWQALCRMEAGDRLNDSAAVDEAVRCVERVLADSPSATPDKAPAPLHAQRTDDQLDHWTYRELSGLHALANLALHADRADWWAAVDRIVDFHMEHTQPDYTTYEPWAVHAFLRRAATRVFAEQQLHDTQTNLHITGPDAALLPALLLADAAQAMGDSRYAVSDGDP